MTGHTKIFRYLGAAILMMGLAIIALGVFLGTEGLAAKREVQAVMAEEQVTLMIDEVKVPVTDQKTVMALANVITDHTLGRYGPWQWMEREDPNRATMLDGLTLRNSLILARMALDISDLITVLGSVFFVIGIAFSATGVVIIGTGKSARKETAT